MNLHKKISQIITSDLPSESFVKEILKYLEFLEARLALLALSEWQQTDKFYPFLYQPFTNLLKPVWGAWHHLLIQLFKARKELLNSQLLIDKDKAQNLNLTAKLKEYFDHKLSDADFNLFLSAGAFLEFKDPFFRISRLWEIAVVLRNHQAHFYPNSEWYDKAAVFLKLIAKYLLATLPTEILDDDNNYKSLWFKQIDNNLFQFGGLKRTDAVNYLHFEQDAQTDELVIDTFSRIYAKLIGEQTENAEELKKLIQKTMPEELAGVYLKNYYLGKPVAEGGFAFIHKAVNLNTGSVVAVKILKDGADSVTKERFKNEAELLSQATHNNIVKVFDYGEAVWTKGDDKIEGEWYEQFKNSKLKTFIVMEWIDGSSLKQIFDEHKPENEKILINWFKQSALALQYIHDINLIHRDIKPGNIMVDRFGEVKIMDFGIAKSSLEDATSLTFTGQTIGTPVYMSPEQIELESKEKELTSATDIYSLCATFYEMITNKRLYHSDTTDIHTINTKKLKGELPDAPLKLVKGLDSQLNEILLGGLRTEPAQRYKSMKALAEDLERYLANKPILYKKPNMFKLFKLVYKRNKGAFRVAGAAVVVLVVTGLGFGYFMQQKQVEVEQSKMQVAVVSDSLKTFNNAFSLVDANIKKEPMNPEWYKQKGEIYYYLNKFEDAISYYTQAINLDPQNDVYYGLRIFCYAKLEKYAEAVNDATIAIELKPQESYYIARATAYKHLTKYGLAESDYLKVLELNKNSPYANFSMAEIYDEGLNIPKRAIPLYSKCIEIKYMLPTSYYSRGWCYQRTGNFADAIKDYTISIDLLPANNAITYVRRATCYKNLNKIDLAIADFTRGIEIDSNNIVAIQQRAYCYQITKDYQNAIKDYTTCIKKSDFDDLIYYGRAVCYMSLAQYEASIRDYTMAIKRVTENKQYLDNQIFLDRLFMYYKGRCFSNALNKNIKKALEDLNQCLEFNPYDQELHKLKNELLEADK